MISVVIPTYNEKKNISKILYSLLKIKIISEIIFVDDKSTDGTYEEILKYKKKKIIKCFLRISKIKDLSKSVFYGVNKSKNKIVLIMDCDLQHNPSYIYKMYEKYKKKKCDIVISSRFEKKKILGNLGYLRSVISKIAINIINFLFGKKSSDPLSGFFICDKNLIINYKNSFFLRGYKILFDIIYNGKKNIQIRHLKIYFNKRKYENSKFNFKVIMLFLGQILHTLLVEKKIK